MTTRYERASGTEELMTCWKEYRAVPHLGSPFTQSQPIAHVVLARHAGTRGQGCRSMKTSPKGGNSRHGTHGAFMDATLHTPSQRCQLVRSSVHTTLGADGRGEEAAISSTEKGKGQLESERWNSDIEGPDLESHWWGQDVLMQASHTPGKKRSPLRGASYRLPGCSGGRKGGPGRQQSRDWLRRPHSRPERAVKVAAKRKKMEKKKKKTKKWKRKKKKKQEME